MAELKRDTPEKKWVRPNGRKRKRRRPGGQRLCQASSGLALLGFLLGLFGRLFGRLLGLLDLLGRFFRGLLGRLHHLGLLGLAALFLLGRGRGCRRPGKQSYNRCFQLGGPLRQLALLRHNSTPSSNEVAKLVRFSRQTSGKEKGAPRGAPFCALWDRGYSSPPFFLGVFFLRAAPRMSPRLAPLSEEPYCSPASFSSEISRALMERETLRLALSTLVTRASTFSPLPKRSGRWSLRSRARAARRMKERTPPSSSTSMPPSFTSVTVPVTTWFFLRAPPPAPALSIGSLYSCLMPRLTRSFSTSMSSTLALTIWPFE